MRIPTEMKVPLLFKLGKLFAQQTILHHTAPHHSAEQHSTAPHRTAPHSTAQHRTAQHTTAHHSTALHSTQCYTVPCRNILHRGGSVLCNTIPYHTKALCNMLCSEEVLLGVLGGVESTSGFLSPRFSSAARGLRNARSVMSRMRFRVKGCPRRFRV